MAIRVGLGTDLHRLVEGRPLILGGVHIPSERGAFGHSDADVLLHAIIDALLGAAGLGDIGEWFPNTDPQWAGADSTELLQAVRVRVANDGWSIVNLDCVITTESPKLSDWKKSIRENLAQLLGVDSDRINVKAKSGEKVGPIGRGEAIAAEAIVLIEQTSSC